jgi:hypothetical protein
MAGGKETPRQKMIGMMYLVLTAMLALNVSKSILDAFVTIDEQALEQNSTLIKSINGIGTTIQARVMDPQSKKTAEVIQDKYFKLRDEVNPVDDFFLSELNEMMEVTEGEKSWFTKDDKQITTFLDLQTIKKKDDYDTPSNLFGGIEGNSKKRGMALRDKMIELRDKVILSTSDSVRDDKNKWHVITKADLSNYEGFEKKLKTTSHPFYKDLIGIYSMLTKEEKVPSGRDRKEKDWNEAMFYHQPMVGAIATMTSLRNDIRLAQERASKMLLSRIDKPMMNINKVDAQVIANTQYLNVGEKLTVKVGIVAYDSTKTYPIRYRLGEGGDLNIADSGSFEISAGAPGARKLSGTLDVELNGEVRPLPFAFEYTVGKPSASIAAPELNVMYRGYDNKIQAVASGYPTEAVKVSCSGCSSFSKKGDLYIARVAGGQEATVSVTADGKKIGFQKFRIMPMPKPQPYFGGTTYGDKTIKTGILKQTPPLTAKLADSPLDINFSVKSFTLDVIVNGKIITEKGNGGTLSPKMKNMVKNAGKGQKIYISDVMVAGPDGKSKPIGGLTLKVI